MLAAGVNRSPDPSPEVRIRILFAIFALLSACGKPGAVPTSVPAQAVTAPSVTVIDSEGQPVADTPETIGPNYEDAPAPDPAPSAPVVRTVKSRGYDLPAFEESWGLSRAVYDKAVEAMAESRSFPNQRFVVLIDMSRYSSARRFFLFDLHTGKLERHNVAHGSGSDPMATGYARIFANTVDSKKTSLGIYKTGATYQGKHGLQLRLAGLEASNSEALTRGIVLHGANYVLDGQRAGRSWGCPAVDQRAVTSVIRRVKGGALLLIWK